MDTTAPIPDDKASADATPPADTGALSSEELAILEFEKQRWKYPAAKESVILDRFGMSATRYYQVLNALLDRPEAMAARAAGRGATAQTSRCPSCRPQTRLGAPEEPVTVNPLRAPT